MIKYMLTVFCLLVTLSAGSAFACDLCAIYRSMEAKTSNPGFNLGIYQQFTHFGTIQDNGKDIGNPLGQKLDSSITQFILGYQFSDRFGVQLSLPYISRSFKRPAYDDAGTLSIDKGTESGLGDLSLIGHYRAVQHLAEDTIFALELIGGIKFPTGSSSRIKEELSEMETPEGMPASGIHGHDLALGSGSYDGIVGTAIFGRWQRLYISSGLQYNIRNRGDYEYRYANDLSWYVKPGGYLWLTHNGTLGLQLAVSGEDKGKDNMAGVEAVDTGITSIFIGPELSFTWKENLSAELGTEFPVVANNTSLQLVPDYRVKAAVSWRF